MAGHEIDKKLERLRLTLGAQVRLMVRISVSAHVLVAVVSFLIATILSELVRAGLIAAQPGSALADWYRVPIP